MEKTLPLNSVKLKIKGKEYEVSFPKMGQFIDIQTLKAKICEGSYEGLVNSISPNEQYSKLLVDMVATFNILIPNLKKDLEVESILSLSLIESKPLLDVYVESWLPFYTSWIEFLNNPKFENEKN